MVHKLIKYYRTKGGKRFFRHLVSRVSGLEEMSYKRWRKLHRISKEELSRQENTEFRIMPKFSIFYLSSGSSPVQGDLMQQSISKQTYHNWEICTAETINEALEKASGDYFVFLNPDGTLEPNALFVCADYINQYGRFDLLYTDEDQMSPDCKKYYNPQFKSGFNLELLRSKDYISHFFIISKEIYRKIGKFNLELAMAQGYDYVLRCSETAKLIVRLPQLLYHKIESIPVKNSYAFMGQSDLEKYILAQHLERCGLQAEVKEGMLPDIHRICYQISEEPVVSVIIPNKDHCEDLRRCIEALLYKSSYKNFEIIIIENNSVLPETFAYYSELQRNYSNIKIITWKLGKEFNYSSLNNFGSKESSGKYLLFLNNDTELIEPDSIKEMVSYAERSEVGIVGARLLYPDKTIQHAGVVLGLGGTAGHAFRDSDVQDAGYDERIFCSQEYSAVTAACMMISAHLFRELDGFDEKLKVAFNDIDLCLRVRKKGKLVIYTPYAELYHYESKSRGLDDTEEKQTKFQYEVQYFRNKWKRELEQGDPYYNPELTLEKHDFSIEVR